MYLLTYMTDFMTWQSTIMSPMCWTLWSGLEETAKKARTKEEEEKHKTTKTLFWPICHSPGSTQTPSFHPGPNQWCNLYSLFLLTHTHLLVCTIRKTNCINSILFQTVQGFRDGCCHSLAKKKQHIVKSGTCQLRFCVHSPINETQLKVNSIPLREWLEERKCWAINQLPNR